MPKLNQQLIKSAGIHFPHEMELIQPNIAHDWNLAMDAQPGLVTVGNAGIPSMLTNFIDPSVIEALVSPMKAAVILGETQKGSWIMDTATFPMIEYTGETSAYGDYSNNGSSGANASYPQRQSFHYQTITQWGERELERAGLAKLDWASRLNIASILILNKFQNQTYFFGVAGLQNYGLLNDPRLTTPITPIVKAATGVLWSAGTALEIYQDILNMFSQLQVQSGGLIQMDEKMVLALSPTAAVNLNKLTQYNVNVRQSLRENFPNMRIETAPEYATVSGQLVQMIVETFEGQKTATCAFTEKLRAHAVEVKTSSWLQKKSQGSWGTIVFRPFLISQLLGV
jgi:hypothetical protein